MLGNHSNHDHNHDKLAFEGKGNNHHNLNHHHILPAFEGKGLRPRNSVNFFMSGRTNGRNWKSSTITVMMMMMILKIVMIKMLS